MHTYMHTGAVTHVPAQVTHKPPTLTQPRTGRLTCVQTHTHYTHIHNSLTHAHTHVHTYAHMFTHIPPHTHTGTLPCAHMHTYTRHSHHAYSSHMCIHTHTHIHTPYRYTPMCTYAHTHMCLPTWACWCCGDMQHESPVSSWSPLWPPQSPGQSSAH